MIDEKFRLVLSIVSAATTLLGSVGIFVSLTVQRRVERLQDILEEFLDLSYHSDINITGKMYNLIEKYQMHYMFPDTPVKVILHYINFTIITVILSWVVIMAEDLRWYDWFTIINAIPLFFGFALLFFFRNLLKSLIYPFGNNLMSPLIPPPSRLRSVSFLSRYVNVSVKSILRQARIRLVIKNIKEKQAKVVLKEELSFDDYIYYLIIQGSNAPLFVAFGKLRVSFDNEPITGKPVPVAKNVNIPMGVIPSENLKENFMEAKLFVFPRGEKHPVEFFFRLKKQGDVTMMITEPEVSVNYMITYRIEKDKLHTISDEIKYPFLDIFCGKPLNGVKKYWYGNDLNPENIENCTEKAYID